MANVSSSNGIEKYPKLRFPEFTGPWRDIKLSDVSSYRNKRTTVSKVKYVSTENMLQNYAGLEPYTEDTETDGIAISSDDTLLANIRPYLKKVWKSEFNGACSTDVLAFSPEQINPDFLYSLIAQDKFIDYVMSGAKGSKMPRGDKSHIMDYATSIPSEDEQHIISNFVNLINKRIAAQNNYIELLKKYKRGLLDKLLEDNNVDANWRTVRLQDVANGFEYGMNSAATTFDGVHKYIRITDIDDDSRQYLSDDIVSPSDTPEEKYRVNANDILFARTGSSVGKSYLYNSEDGELYFAGFLIRISVKKEYDSYFVYLNTLTSKYEKWLRLESMRSGQPGVNAEQYRNYAFRCPNYQSQVKIANIIKGIDLRIAKERIFLSKLNSLKNGLLQQLFI